LTVIAKIETVDPLHKWIGTYNLYSIELTRFFKWLHYPHVEYKTRPKPSVIENIHQLKRKEKSIYKPTDLWTPEDDSLFLKYCPNARDKCYHAMSRDSACRPHELLKLKIKDAVFKLTPDKKQYAEILVNGKTGTRHIPLIDSIPYIVVGFVDPNGNPRQNFHQEFLHWLLTILYSLATFPLQKRQKAVTTHHQRQDPV
jgi:integrase